MIITDIRLQNFRSYQDASFELGSGINIIVGPNASGKTNLLEAVLVSAGHNSYRAPLQELIGYDQPWARLDVHTPVGTRTVKIRSEPLEKAFEIDGKTYRRLPVAKKLPVCLFEPNHLLLLSGSPELRRSYVDNLCEQIYPEFGLTLRQFKRVLAQRNNLLKQAGAANQIFSWNIRLAELAGKIVVSRLRLIKTLNQSTTETYQALSSTSDKVNVAYSTKLSTDNYETALLKKLEQNLNLEIQRGFTLYGPHRDDLEIMVNNRSSLAISRGETRTLVLTLKILEARILDNVHNDKSLLLLDDVFSELDGSRRQKLTKYLQGHQVFITTTDADVILQHFTESANIIPLSIKDSSRRLHN